MIVTLNPKQAAILRVLDGLRHYYEYVALRRIVRRLPYRKKNILEEIKVMEREKLVKVKVFEEPYVKITNKGRDWIAIWDYIKHEEFDFIVRTIGKGKEAEIYLVYGEKNGYGVLKIHRYYRKEFEKYKRSFTYNAIEYWGEKFRWKNISIDFPRLKAKVEYTVLNSLYNKGFRVPKPYSWNRHTVLMEFLGDEDPYPKLVEYFPEKENFREEFFEEYNRIVEKGRFVHGDLNPYNVLVSEEDFWIIDWPQAIPKRAPFWEEMYMRDIKIMEDFFTRRLS